MNKQTYMIPEVGVQPLHLSACIMSGGGSVPVPPPYTDPQGEGPFEACKRRVY